VGAELYTTAEAQVLRDLRLRVAVESRLSNSGYTGYSTTAWFLVADPAQADVMEVAFLDGNEQPVTESFEDFDRLALKYRAWLACGVKALDWRGIVKSKGAS
jgi:hypothetical protein